MDLSSESADKLRQLPTFSRSIRLENRLALVRRWQLARTGALSDPRLVNRWFPGQRDLLSLLEVMSEEEVERVADTDTPLFGLQLRCTDFSLRACGAFPIQERLEVESVAESFLALSSRLDLVRLSVHQACVNFSLTYTEATWLSNYCPHELQLLARDPSMVLYFVASSEYVMAAAHDVLKPNQRTIFSATSRRGAVARMT